MSKIMELADAYSEQYDDAYGKDGNWEEARAALAEEVEKLEKEHIDRLLRIEQKVDELIAERDALREKLAAVEKDAARYRWLRERDDWVLMPGMRSEVCLRSNLDDQIDMSMGAFIGASK